jgi:hypothetical protein
MTLRYRLKRIMKGIFMVDYTKALKESTENVRFVVRLYATYDEETDSTGYLVEKFDKENCQMLTRVPYSEAYRVQAKIHYEELVEEINKPVGKTYAGVC